MLPAASRVRRRRRRHGATILPPLVREVDSWSDISNTGGLSGSLTVDDVEFHARRFSSRLPISFASMAEKWTNTSCNETDILD
jgi:hypothetical protein